MILVSLKLSNSPIQVDFFVHQLRNTGEQFSSVSVPPITILAISIWDVVQLKSSVLCVKYRLLFLKLQLLSHFPAPFIVPQKSTKNSCYHFSPIKMDVLLKKNGRKNCEISDFFLLVFFFDISSSRWNIDHFWWTFTEKSIKLNDYQRIRLFVWL